MYIEKDKWKKIPKGLRRSIRKAESKYNFDWSKTSKDRKLKKLYKKAESHYSTFAAHKVPIVKAQRRKLESGRTIVIRPYFRPSKLDINISKNSELTQEETTLLIKLLAKYRGSR